MNRYFEILNKRVAGVPVYVFGLVGAVLLGVVAWRMKGSSAPASAGDTSADSAGAGTSTGASDGSAFDVRNPIFVSNPLPVQNVPDSQPADTNDAWSRRAIEWLVSNGKAPEEAARVAIQQYLDGAVLTVSQNDLKNLAVKQFGLPPDLPTGGGVDVPSTPAVNSAPATRQGNPPLRHKVKNDRDNQYSELARIYYGRTDSIAVNLLRAANATRDAQEPFPVGTYIYVPKWITPRFYRATSATRTADDIARKNSTTGARILALNYGVAFPVKVGTSVRVA